MKNMYPRALQESHRYSGQKCIMRAFAKWSGLVTRAQTVLAISKLIEDRQSTVEKPGDSETSWGNLPSSVSPSHSGPRISLPVILANLNQSLSPTFGACHLCWVTAPPGLSFPLILPGYLLFSLLLTLLQPRARCSLTQNSSCL